MVSSDVAWQHRTWVESPSGMAFDVTKAGGNPSRYPRFPWGATFYGDKGTLEASVMGYTFTPADGRNTMHKDVQYEYEQYPEDRTEKDLERHVAPAIRGHIRDWLAAVDARSRPVADIEQGFISTTSCILANLSMNLGRSLAFDPTIGKIPHDDQANELLKRTYRGPSVHPAETTRS